MPFNPKEMTPSTVKGFVDRLHRFAKATDTSEWPPKRSWSQEAVARTLGFPTFHALQVALEEKTDAPKAARGWVFESPTGQAFFRVSPEWYHYRSAEAGFTVPMALWQDPVLIQGDERERKQLFTSLAKQARTHALPVLWVQGPWALSAPPQLDEAEFRTRFSLDPAFNALLFHSSAATLTELLALSMEDWHAENSMWKGRAISMASSVLFALVYLRDRQGFSLTVDSLADALRLESVMALSQRDDLPENVLQSVRAYLRSLPGYKDKASASEQDKVVIEQHGFVQMLFTRILRAWGSEGKVLRFSDNQALSLSETTDEMPVFPMLLESWANSHPGGVLFLDGLTGKSSILNWLPRAIPRLVDQGIRIALGTRYLNDWSLPADAMQPLLSRMPNGFILQSASDDPWVNRAALAGWRTANGRG